MVPFSILHINEQLIRSELTAQYPTLQQQSHYSLWTINPTVKFSQAKSTF